MPILHSGLETDLRLAAQLDQALLVSLTDMASIRNVPGAIDFHGSVNGSGSDTGRLRFVSLGGADHMAAATEGTTVTETALTDTSVDIAVTRHALVRNIGDLATLTGYGADVNPQTLAADMVASYDGRFNDLFCAAGATASTNVGTSGVDMSHGDWMDAVFTLELNSVPGPYFAVLHPRQFADWQESLRAEGGALQFYGPTAEMLAVAGQGYAGTFLGVNILKMSDVTEAASNKEGFFYGAGAFGYKVAQPDQRLMLGAGAGVAVSMDEILVEVVRDPAGALTQISGNAWCGISVKEQARLVGCVTDA
jgi:hypothetical protein